MTIFVNYEEHPEYIGMQNNRLEKIAEGKFFPQFKIIQSAFFDILEHISSEKFKYHIHDKSCRYGIKLFDLPPNDVRHLASLINEANELRNKTARNRLIFTPQDGKTNNDPRVQKICSEINKIIQNHDILEFLHAQTGFDWKIDKIEANGYSGNYNSSGDQIIPVANEANWEINNLRVGESLFEHRVIIQFDNIKRERTYSFSYVEGSQRWFAPIDLIIRRAVHHSGMDSIAEAGTRMLFYNLPSFFRRRCELGFDLNEAMTKYWSFLRQFDGNSSAKAILFDCDGLFSRPNVLGEPGEIEISFRPSCAIRILSAAGI